MGHSPFLYAVHRRICRELYQQPHTHRGLVATITARSLTIHAAITDLRTNMLLTGYQTATDTPTTVYVLTPPL